MSVRRMLVIALAVQLGLVAISWWPGGGAAARLRPVFDLERDEVEEIEIVTRPLEDAASEPLVLARAEDGWTLRSAGDYPATKERVDALLDSLLGLTTTGPITTQAASHEALKVSDDAYGRRIRVVAGGEAAEWLIGAATNRSIHMRQVGEDDVYLARGASEWSFEDGASSYYDASYVDGNIAAMDAVAVHNEHGDLRFAKDDDAWTLADLASDEIADAEAIASFVSSVAKLRMSEPVGREVLPAYGLSRGLSGGPSQALRVDWTLVSEDQSEAGGYAVGAEVEGDRYVKAVDQLFVVRAAASAVQQLQDAARSEFVK